jgi:hypothetical protein
MFLDYFVVQTTSTSSLSPPSGGLPDLTTASVKTITSSSFTQNMLPQPSSETIGATISISPPELTGISAAALRTFDISSSEVNIHTPSFN